MSLSCEVPGSEPGARRLGLAHFGSPKAIHPSIHGTHDARPVDQGAHIFSQTIPHLALEM